MVSNGWRLLVAELPQFSKHKELNSANNRDELGRGPQALHEERGPANNLIFNVWDSEKGTQ